ALGLIQPGMRLGLGTGSTAIRIKEALAQKHRAGMAVVCVPTSETTRRLAESLGLPLTTLDESPALDITIDGADEIDPKLRLIKGGGGALLREKIVATSSDRMIVIADHAKRVDVLGKFPLPVEIVPFGARATLAKIEAAAARVGCTGAIALRKRNEKLFLTDNGNVVADCAFARIADPESLAVALSAIPGVVEHGLFIGIAALAIIAAPSGIETLQRQP
ncbi:ribose-5-phosphate isomerase RpiA, partial [Rhizobium sp.]|uniref:ribose-5-phosphate isomerase RpiA n=1 Tax=Rhizobium sp. TaxID=391 RepID=UPI00389AB318